MPAFCTHYLFCADMLEIIGNQPDFKVEPDACAIGTQGPDIFFFGRLLPVVMPGKSLRKIGSAIHKSKPAELFDAFADYCAFSPNPSVAKSYIYGFIMHYALDRKCHPFVYSFQQQILDSSKKKMHRSAAHNRIEHSMDTYFLYKRLGITDPSDFDTASTFACSYDVAEEIAHLLSFVVPRVTDFQLTEQQALCAINDTVTMQKLLRNKNNTMMRATLAVDNIFGPLMYYYKISSNINPKDLEKAKKYANINNRVWYSPYDPDVPRTESYVDLFDIAKDECLDLINGFEHICRGYSSGRDVTHNISFLTGTEV